MRQTAGDMAEPTTSDDLYAVDPGDFVAARDRLARSLRAEGERDEAARVAKLRRPPQSTWALNLLARTDPDRIDVVLASATALRDTLADGGGDRRAAQTAYREAIDAAVAAAADLAGVTGEDMRTRIRTNLLAAGVDEDLARQLQNGTLPDDQEAPGFGGTPTIGPLAPRAAATGTTKARRSATPSRSKAGRSDAKASTTAAERKEAAATTAAAARAEAADRARQAEDELAHKRVARERAELGRELERRQRKARRLEEQAVAAEDRATEARRAADEAAAAEAEITTQLDHLDHLESPPRSL